VTLAVVFGGFCEGVGRFVGSGCACVFVFWCSRSGDTVRIVCSCFVSGDAGGGLVIVDSVLHSSGRRPRPPQPTSPSRGRGPRSGGVPRGCVRDRLGGSLPVVGRAVVGRARSRAGPVMVGGVRVFRYA